MDRVDLRNYATHGYGLWIVETTDGEFVGDCGLTWQVAGRTAPARGGLPRAAIIHPQNTASRRVAEKIGMRRIGDDHGDDHSGVPAVRTVLGLRLEPVE